MQLKNKVAIVTGAAYGIGFATAKRFVDEGATVVLADIKNLDEAASKLSGGPGSATAAHLDVTSDASVNELVERTVARYGSVHILVNNAAISAELRPGRFEEQSAGTWNRVFEVNVVGPFRTCRAVSRHMRAQKWGRIVNVTSGTAFKGSPGMLHYVASKGAVISMTRALANEFGSDNVLVNAVSPGLTMTESIRQAGENLAVFGPTAIATRAIKREAEPIDVAKAIYFLVSSDADFVTGQILAADGGSVYH